MDMAHTTHDRDQVEMVSVYVLYSVGTRLAHPPLLAAAAAASNPLALLLAAALSDAFCC